MSQSSCPTSFLLVVVALFTSLKVGDKACLQPCVMVREGYFIQIGPLHGKYDRLLYTVRDVLASLVSGLVCCDSLST